jgi:hypothetical protein
MVMDRIRIHFREGCSESGKKILIRAYSTY